LSSTNNQIILEHVKSLAFNRSASTTGETRAIYYIKSELEKENIDSKIEHFSFTGYRRVIMRILYTLLISYLLLFRLFLILIAYYIIRNLFEVTRRFSLIKKEESKNLYTIISAKKKIHPQPTIIFSAHYDSFASILPYNLQNFFFFLFKAIILPYLGIMILVSSLLIIDFIYQTYSLIIINLTVISSIIQFIIILFIIILLIDVKKVYGSIDNASGVSILIELVKKVKKKPLENIDVIFIWTGAEEWGTKGSKSFYKTHLKKLKKNNDLNRSYGINIDMVGTYIGLIDEIGLKKKKMNNNLNDIIGESANQLNIPLIKYKKSFEPRSDQRVFKKLSRKSTFQVACFHSNKDCKYIHSSRDSPDKCSEEILKGCLDICHTTIMKLDSQMQ
jgi:hypothetical protein